MGVIGRRRLCDAVQPYDVVMFPDGTLRPDTVTPADLERYRTLVLPDCAVMTAQQADALLGYLDGGGRTVVVGRLGENLDAVRRERLLAHPSAIPIDAPEAVPSALPDGPQVIVPEGLDAAIGLYRVADGVAVHVLRYDYDAALDRVPQLADLQLGVRLTDMAVTGVEAVPSGIGVDLRTAGSLHTLRIRNVPLYTIVILRTGGG